MTVTLLDVTADEYHADPCDTPSLTSTVARALLLETPAHAKQKHPRLADTPWKKETAAMDDGTAVHQLLLGDDRVDVLDYPDWRTVAAREARDASRQQGRVPMLAHRWQELSIVADQLKQQLAQLTIDPPLFTDGMPEQTIVWNEGDVTCRARLDWLRSDFAAIDDLKKSRTAQPRRWERSLWQLGYDIQAAFYVRAVKAAFGVEPVFRWVAIEPDPPYALSVFSLSPQAMSHAQDRVDVALELWAECLGSGVWPAYPTAVRIVELPAWMRSDEWDDRALTEVPF